MPVRLSVFIATSLDGYIATPDGRLDWLEEAAAGEGDYGYEEFLHSTDALAMGRGTYDYIAHVDPLPFGDRPVYVFTHRAVEPRAGVTAWQAGPREAVENWESAGFRRVYVDGGRLIASFLAEGLIDDMTITTVPVLLGEGLPLFPATGAVSTWQLDGLQSWENGVVQRTYVRGG